MKKFLLTHGDAKYWPLLDLQHHWDVGYCDLHDYVFIEDRQSTPGLPDFYWEKMRVIYRCLMNDAHDGDFLAFKDADALIADRPVDLYIQLCTEGFLNYDVACAKYPENNGKSGWNTGTLFVNANDKTRKLFRRLLDGGPIDPKDWGAGHNQTLGWEERAFAKQFEDSAEGVNILSLDSRWNYGNAIRPLGRKACKNAIILHPAEKPLAYKLDCIRRSMDLINAGAGPIDPLADWDGKGELPVYPPMNHDAPGCC